MNMARIPEVFGPHKHFKLSKKKKNKRLIKRLRNEYRLSILKESSYEEQVSVLLTPLNVVLLVGSAFILIGGLVYSLVALSPLKEHLVPGYIDDQYRQDAISARNTADSLLAKQAQYDDYLILLNRVLSGNIHPDSVKFDAQEGLDEQSLSYQLSEPDSLLRNKVAEEDRFTLNLASGANPAESRKFLFTPVEGTLSSKFDPDIEHYGIDIVAPKESIIKSVLEGTVVLASYTSDGGHVIQVQHSGDLISVYKHNSVLLKKTGDRIKAGESIAVIGNTGDHSDGPHLHFELWEKGLPVDPQLYLNISE